MPINASNPVSVGAATRVDQWDRLWNNWAATYAGEMAMTGQLAEDFIAAASATALKRIAATGGQALRKNIANNALELFSPLAILDRDVAEFEVIGTTHGTTETTAYSFTVPGGTLSTNRAIRIIALADFLNGAGARNNTLRLKYGGTAFATGIIPNASEADRQPWMIEATIYAANSASAQVAEARLWVGTAADVSGAWEQITSGSAREFIAAHTGLAIASGSNQALEITMALGGADAALSFKLKAVQVVLLP